MRGPLSCVLSVIILPICSFPLNSTYGSELTFEFSGRVTNVFALPYGNQVAVTEPVHGSFSYETASPGFASGSSMIFLQQPPGKFRATVGSISISADYFDMVVTNNVTPTLDAIGVRFSSSADLGPVVVNGIAQSTGYLSLNFLGSSGLISDNSLPGLDNMHQSVIRNASFSSMLGVFSHAPPGGFPPVPPDVQFVITHLKMVPEPGTAALLACGLPIIVVATRHRKHSRWEAS